METPTPLPLNDYHVKKTQAAINTFHIFLHGIALSALLYYRFTSITQIIKTRDMTQNSSTPLLPNILILVAELVLTFIWLLGQASKLRPVARAVYPERLPEDDRLPPVDVFICTADPNKEPSVGVMNTVVSALALDYPPDKLHVYLSDDGGSTVTFRAMKEAWKFSKNWIVFCRKHGVATRCPEAYFSASVESADQDYKFTRSSEFVADKEEIEKRYEAFKVCVLKIIAETGTKLSRDHPPIIEVMSDDSNQTEMPMLVYVAREKRPSHPHNFKAGALNVLLRVSAMISNAPYILVLDCDMYCNDPGSARQAMCFHLDPKLSPNLAFVQFPQRFFNINRTDIYDCQMRYIRYIKPKWEGMDGLRGPILSGTCFYIKREALYGTQKIQKDVDLVQLQKSFGSSNEFIKSIYKPKYRGDRKVSNNASHKELELLASCGYDNGTKWGEEVGFRYFAVVEDYFTGFSLHCDGWISVYFEPSRPCFLGASPVCLNDVLVQHTRWFFGLMQISLSKFNPLIYGTNRMSTLQTMCYAELAHTSLYSLPLNVLAVVPQLCLLRGIPLYPEVSSPFFFVYSFVFLSYQLKLIQEVLSTGHSIKIWSNEQRIWMMRSSTSYLYSTLNAIMEKIGITKASFVPTNKVVDDEQDKRYQMGVYDFQASAMFMVPLCSLYTLNLASLMIFCVLRKGNEPTMIIQAFIALFVTVMFFPILEGMVLRKDKGRVSPLVSVVSVVISMLVVSSVISCH